MKKRTPCSIYNTEMFEYWLNKEASEGKLLKKAGSSKGSIAVFEESDKINTRYRIWAKKGFTPPNSIGSIRKNYGWKLVTYDSYFDIYCSNDENCELVDSDEYHGIYCKKAIKNVKFNLILSIVFSILILAAGICLLPYISVKHPLGFPGVISIAAMCIYTFIKNFINIKLLNSEDSSVQDYRELDMDKIASKAKGFEIFKIIFLIIMLTVLIGLRYIKPFKSDLPDDKLNIPFATAADFSADKAANKIDSAIISSYFKDWKTLVSSQNHEWFEIAEIATESGEKLGLILEVDYHETADPALAKAVAKTFYFENRYFSSGSFEEFDIAELGYDYGKLYKADIDDYIVLLQRDNKVIRASFTEYRTDSNITDEQIDQFTEIILDKIS